MKHPEITSLYRYRSCESRNAMDEELELIRNGEVWCTTPAHGKLNDPFDCKVAVRKILTSEEEFSVFYRIGNDNGHSVVEIAKLYNEMQPQLPRNMAQFQEDAQTTVDAWPICCFSSTPINVLLWSYYSGSHKGMCIEYERNPENGLGHDEATEKVEYKLQLEMNLTPLDVLDYIDLGQDERQFHPLFHQTLFWKLNNWCHEQEFRYIAGQEEGVNESPGQIKSVTFGMLMDRDDRSYVMQQLGAVVDYFEIGQKDDSFILERHMVVDV